MIILFFAKLLPQQFFYGIFYKKMRQGDVLQTHFKTRHTENFI